MIIFFGDEKNNSGVKNMGVNDPGVINPGVKKNWG